MDVQAHLRLLELANNPARTPQEEGELQDLISQQNLAAQQAQASLPETPEPTVWTDVDPNAAPIPPLPVEPTPEPVVEAAPVEVAPTPEPVVEPTPEVAAEAPAEVTPEPVAEETPVAETQHQEEVMPEPQVEEVAERAEALISEGERAIHPIILEIERLISIVKERLGL